MRKNIIILLAIIIALIIGRLAISNMDRTKEQNQKKSAMTPSATVEEVGTANIQREFIATARVTAKYRVNVLARISGYLTKSYFKEGDSVKAGQVLFEIEPQQYQYAANKARADLDTTISQAEYYQKQLIRYEELVKNDYVAKADYDNILAQQKSYNASVESAESAYRDAQRNLGYTHIKSPVDGRVGIIDVTVGNYVTPNSGALTTINSSNPMYVTFTIDSKDYAELVRIDGNEENRKVEFIFSSGKKYDINGVQDFHDNKIDSTTGTITLRATFPNPDNELIQGDFGRIKIYSNKKDNLPTIPQSATMENQEGRYVYVLDEKQLPKLVYIKTMGQTEDGKWLVSDGLQAGDKILTSGLQRIIPGHPVRIVSKEVNTKKELKKEGLISKIIRKIKNIGKNK